HERTMLWLSFADRLQDLVDDMTPITALDRDHYATLVMDTQALRLLGSAALARGARGEEDVAGMSVLKLLGSEAVQAASEHAVAALGADGLIHPAVTSPHVSLNLDPHVGSWFDRYVRSFAGTIAGGTSEIQRNIIAQRVLGLPR
ncbi:MAG: acyl-CoA dehydrogenase family protein, partial [Mycobacterium sp.]|nr:acyl-CoA dehydrogenase family protein [Mycobacterium sp.]